MIDNDAWVFAKTIEKITGITMKDIEGNAVERVFDADEITAIQTAFNECFIMDTAYIEMITGNT